MADSYHLDFFLSGECFDAGFFFLGEGAGAEGSMVCEGDGAAGAGVFGAAFAGVVFEEAAGDVGGDAGV